MKREGNGLYHYHWLLLDKEVVDGKVKQDFFTRVKELQGVILNKLADLRVDLINCKNKVTSRKLNCPSRKQLI